MVGLVTHLQRLKHGCWHALSSHFACWAKPLTSSLPLQTMADLNRSRSELVAENALLHQQLLILRRQVKRPSINRTDRMLLVLLARLVRTWQQALLIVQPDTLLRWHRELFRLFWKRKSKTRTHKPKVAAETIALIRQMATENRLWGAERIRGERAFAGHTGLQADDPEVHENGSFTPSSRPEVGNRSRVTTQDRSGRVTRLQVTDLFFRPLFAFFIIELKSRKVIQVGVTHSPTDAWVARTAARSHALWTSAKVPDSG
jgi:putative transposase